MAEKKKAKTTQPKKKPAEPKKSSAKLAATDQVLGTLSAADADTKLDSPVPASAPASMRKKDGTVAEKPEPLQLPKGALLAMRQSGGHKFTSSEIVIYPDGHVAYGGGDTSHKAYERGARKLNDGQVVGLRHSLDRVNFWRMPATTGKQNPDAFAYEITARVGSKANSIQVFDGSIPDSLKPILEQLKKLMPSEE